jgi:PAS domain S-box-containing protein
VVKQIGETLIDSLVTTREHSIKMSKMLETALRLDAAFVNALYNGLTDAILAVQFGTRRIVHWNKGAEVMFGYPAQEVLGKTTGIIYPDQDSFERISELATPNIRAHGSWQAEWEYRRRDGSCFPADVVATMIQGSQGAEFYVIVIRDISARKQSEAALREQSALLQKSQQRLQAILDNTTMVIYIVDADGKFVLVNRQFARLFHLNAEIAGTALDDVFDDETAHKFLENNARVLAARTPMEFEETVAQDDDLRTYLSVKVPLINESAIPYAVCGVSTDITERKRDQEKTEMINAELEVRVTERTAQLQASNELLRKEITNRRQAEEKLRKSERMATIGVTAAKLAHEIANPLQAMNGVVAELEQHLSQGTSPRRAILNDLVGDFRTEVNRLMALLDEFRNITRPMNLDIQAVNLVALAGEVLMLEAPHYAKSGIRIEENFAADLRPVAADPIKLKQVLLNLFKNAAEAMPDGGTLTVSAYRAEADFIFEVTDTGVGIPGGINVFELFTTSKPIGTGLGLAIVKDIVAGHRGSITYTSQTGKGTTFQLKLPLLREPALLHEL